MSCIRPTRSDSQNFFPPGGVEGGAPEAHDENSAESYTVIETSHDEIVTPYQSAFLPAERGRVTNVLLQRDCPADLSEHVTIPYDPVAIQWILNALGRPCPADPGFRPDCTGLALLTG